MKTTSLLIVQVCSLLLGFSPLNSIYAQDTLVKPKFEYSTNDSDFSYVLKNETARLAQVNSGSASGNYAGISTADNNLSLAYNIPLRKFGLLEINAAGGIKEGIAQLISSDKLNAGATLGLKYKRLFITKLVVDSNADLFEKREIEAEYAYKIELQKIKQSVGKMKSDVTNKKNEIQQLEQKRIELKYLNLSYSKDTNTTLFIDNDKAKNLVAKRNALIARQDVLKEKYRVSDAAIQNEIVRINASYSLIKNPTVLDSLKHIYAVAEVKSIVYHYSDSLASIKDQLKILDKEVVSNTFKPTMIEDVLSEIEKANLELEQLIKLLEFDNPGWMLLQTIKLEKQKKIDAINKERSEVKTIGHRVHWLSGGLSLTSENFSLYNSALPINERVYKQTDLVPTISTSYTYYVNDLEFGNDKKGIHNLRYFSLNAWLKSGNNVSGLKQVDVETRDSIASNQTIVSTQKAYSGEFKRQVVSANVSLDYYQLFGVLGRAGFHMRLGIDIGPFAPVTSFRVGAMFVALNRDKEDALVNFELFIGLNNLFKSGEEESLLSRNVFGIQTTFPFNVKLK